jgi:hypothetical protein
VYTRWGMSRSKCFTCKQLQHQHQQIVTQHMQHMQQQQDDDDNDEDASKHTKGYIASSSHSYLLVNPTHPRVPPTKYNNNKL